MSLNHVGEGSNGNIMKFSLVNLILDLLGKVYVISSNEATTNIAQSYMSELYAVVGLNIFLRIDHQNFDVKHN